MTRFSLRDVFWLTLVVAMGCGWTIDRMALASLCARWEQALDDWAPSWRKETGPNFRPHYPPPLSRQQLLIREKDKRFRNEFHPGP
jgi:hypothetical protein